MPWRRPGDVLGKSFVVAPGDVLSVSKWFVAIDLVGVKKE